MPRPVGWPRSTTPTSSFGGPARTRRLPDPGAEAARRGGPPPPRPTRPVTARLDTTDTLHPRNATTSRADGRRTHPAGQPPIRARAADTGPRRASDPNGPLVRSRVHRFRPPRRPSLEVARRSRCRSASSTATRSARSRRSSRPTSTGWRRRSMRDPDLLAAARVVRDDLDRRGIVRRTRPYAGPAGPADGLRAVGPAEDSGPKRRSPPVPSGVIVRKAHEDRR